MYLVYRSGLDTFSFNKLKFEFSLYFLIKSPIMTIRPYNGVTMVEEEMRILKKRYSI